MNQQKTVHHQQKMERQISLSFKPSRILIFSFTLCSSVFFLTLFAIWVYKFTPFHQPPPHNLLLDDPSNFSVIGLKDSLLAGTHFTKSQNTSGFVKKSRFGDIQLGNNQSVVVKEVNKERDNTVVLSETVPAKIIQIKSGLDKIGEEEKKRVKQECDVTKGKWVFDESYPLYSNFACPFIDEGFNCMANGRLDKDYMKWRWQPLDCDIPRFNATNMLELIRGKRLVFVGDSINRNQWESMLCLLMGAIKNPKRVLETHGRKISKEKTDFSFRFLDYQCTVEYYVTHFLVHEGKAKVGNKRVQTLRIDSIDRGSSKWRRADVLVFNTANWWSHFKTKSGKNYYQEGNQVFAHLDVLTAYKRALMTWASWVEKHIKPNKTHVFFRSSTPSHFRGGQWNSGGHCGEVTRPFNETININYYPKKNQIAEEVIKGVKTPIIILNVTRLTGYRIDGHPSRYGKPRDKPQSSTQDCSHWCLPGVPDTWNELLYFHLQSKQNGK